jgi:hypothetical protein
MAQDKQACAMAEAVMAIGETTATAKKWRSAMMMTDELDAQILDLRVMGVPEFEICRRLGVTIAQIHAVLDARARVTLAPENVEQMLIRSLDRLKTVERVFAAEPGRAARRVVEQSRRQQARTGKLILQRASASRPM